MNDIIGSDNMSLLYAVCTAGICHFRCIFQAAELLPLLVGLIGVYNFYQVVLTLTGQTELFGRLKDMLLIQVLYLILIYIMDFLKIHIPYGCSGLCFVCCSR